MAMSSDPGCRWGGNSDSDQQPGDLAEMMAAVAVTTGKTVGEAANGVKNGAKAKKVHPPRPHLSGRKMSLQERGTHPSAGGGSGNAHVSPRVARRPTVESKRVSISDSQVGYKQTRLQNELNEGAFY